MSLLNSENSRTPSGRVVKLGMTVGNGFSEDRRTKYTSLPFVRNASPPVPHRMRLAGLPETLLITRKPTGRKVVLSNA